MLKQCGVFSWVQEYRYQGMSVALDSNIFFMPYSFLPQYCVLFVQKEAEPALPLGGTTLAKAENILAWTVFEQQEEQMKYSWTHKELWRQSILLVTAVAAAASVSSSLTSTKKTLPLSAPASSTVTLISSISFSKGCTLCKHSHVVNILAFLQELLHGLEALTKLQTLVH